MKFQVDKPKAFLMHTQASEFFLTIFNFYLNFEKNEWHEVYTVYDQIPEFKRGQQEDTHEF